MKILILSFYYRPDLSAGSFRTTALVKALKAQAPEVDIDVVTTLPNRYHSFSVEAPEREALLEATITRIALPAHKSGIMDQSKAFLHFARKSLSITKGERYDLVFATSSRLMTAVLGTWIARQKSCPLYLDIRDIFVDTIKDVLPRRIAGPSRFFFSFIEQWAIKRASKVNLVSGGFRQYFESRYPNQKFAYFTNGIDDEFIAATPLQESPTRLRKPLVALYAGNLGEGQGLHEILPPLAERCKGRIHFKVFGDGGRKKQLLAKLSEMAVSNVEILPPVPRDVLIKEYQQADILFLHLGNYDAFEKVLPSKVFEYGALGKPIWAGIPGFSADFVRSELDNAAVFQPCNVDEAMRVLETLQIQDRPRIAFIQKYSRDVICREMAADILVTVRAK